MGILTNANNGLNRNEIAANLAGKIAQNRKACQDLKLCSGKRWDKGR